MPANQEFCQSQIFRFSGMRNFPREDEAFSELVATLARYAVSDPHAKEAVEAILETATAADYCPLPGDIRRVLYERRPEGAGAKCERCCGRGWISFDKIINGVPYAFSAPCECRPKPQERSAPAAKRDGSMGRADFKSMASRE